MNFLVTRKVRWWETAQMTSPFLSCRTLQNLGPDALNFPVDGGLDAFGLVDSLRDLPDVLGSNAEPPGNPAVESVKMGGQFKLRSCRLIGRVQVKPLSYAGEDSPGRIFCQAKNWMSAKKEELPLYAQKLRDLRDKLGFRRQAEFATALGTRQATVSRWLNGTARPLPSVFMRIAGLAQGEDRIYFLKEGGVLIEEDDRGIEIVVGSEKGAPEPLRPELLAFAMEMAEAELKREGRKRQNPQYAQLVAQIYDFCHREGSLDPARVRDLFRTARSVIHILESGPHSDKAGEVEDRQENRSHHGRIATGRK